MVLEIIAGNGLIILSGIANLLLIASFTLFICKLHKDKSRLKNRIAELEAVSDQSKQKETILQSLQNANKKNEKYISILSREIDKPFNSLLSKSNSLAAEFEFLSNEEKIKIVEQLNTTIISSMNKFQNLFAWIRYNNGDQVFSPCQFQLNDCITEVVKNVSNYAIRKQIDQELDIQPELNVVADKSMVGTIIRNLIYNAIDSSKENSKIIIQAFNTAGTTKVSVLYYGDQLSEQEKNVLLAENVNRFSKEIETDYSAGAELVLVKELIKKNGGELWINSEVDNENKFTFTLTSSGKKST